MMPDVNNPETSNKQEAPLLQNGSEKKKGLFAFLRDKFPISRLNSFEERPKSANELVQMDEEGGPNFLATSSSSPRSPVVGRVARTALMRSSS